MNDDSPEDYNDDYFAEVEICNILCLNLCGRFKGNEIKAFGNTVISHILQEKKVNFIFGQQLNFRLNLPDDFSVIGGQRAFIVYDKRHFYASDERQYRHYLRELEMNGQLSKYYLPEGNYELCRMRSKKMPRLNFIAISYLTDEVHEELKCMNLLRKLLSFAANLCAIEEIPVLIGGTFRLSLEKIKQIVYNEYEGFRCYGYKTENIKRQQRMSGVFISCPPLKLINVKPLVCGKLGMVEQKFERKRNPEEAFYWDPVMATLFRRSHASSIISPASPVALSPPLAEEEDADSMIEHECTTPTQEALSKRLARTPSPSSPVFPPADETLRSLLYESDQIKNLVNDAERRALKRMKGTDDIPMIDSDDDASSDYLSENYPRELSTIPETRESICSEDNNTYHSIADADEVLSELEDMKHFARRLQRDAEGGLTLYHKEHATNGITKTQVNESSATKTKLRLKFTDGTERTYVFHNCLLQPNYDVGNKR